MTMNLIFYAYVVLCNVDDIASLFSDTPCAVCTHELSCEVEFPGVTNIMFTGLVFTSFPTSFPTFKCFLLIIVVTRLGTLS